MTKINLNQIINSLFPSSILRTNASNELEYVAPGTVGQILGVDAFGLLNYIDPVSLVTVQSGLTELGTSTFELGGTLLHNTSIDQSTFNMDWERSMTGGQFARFQNGTNLLGGSVEGIGTSVYDPTTTFTAYDLLIPGTWGAGVVDATGALADGSNITATTSVGDVSISQSVFSGGYGITDTQQINTATSLAEKVITVNNSMIGSSTAIKLTPLAIEIKTPTIATNTAVNGQVLTLIDATFGTVEYQGLGASYAQRTKNTQTVTGTTVTLPSAPNVLTLDVYRNGLLQEETTDYTVSGSTLTFIVALVAEKITSIYFV